MAAQLPCERKYHSACELNGKPSAPDAPQLLYTVSVRMAICHGLHHLPTPPNHWDALCNGKSGTILQGGCLLRAA